NGCSGSPAQPQATQTARPNAAIPAGSAEEAFWTSDNGLQRPRSPRQRSARAAAKQTGRNARADSLAVMASAVAAPTIALRHAFGYSSHRTKANKAETHAAATGISVVARPACPRSGGVVTRISAAAAPATVPKSRCAQSHVIATRATKKGSTPSRAAL